MSWNGWQSSQGEVASAIPAPSSFISHYPFSPANHFAAAPHQYAGSASSPILRNVTPLATPMRSSATYTSGVVNARPAETYLQPFTVQTSNSVSRASPSQLYSGRSTYVRHYTDLQPTHREYVEMVPVEVSVQEEIIQDIIEVPTFERRRRMVWEEFGGAAPTVVPFRPVTPERPVPVPLQRPADTFAPVPLPHEGAQTVAPPERHGPVGPAEHTLQVKVVTVPQVQRVEVPVERLVEKIVKVPEVRIVEVPVDRVIERRVEVPVDRVVERVVKVPEVTTVEVPVETIKEKIVTVPVQRTIEVPIEKFVERIVKIPEVRTVEIPVERIIEKIVQVPIEKIVEVPVDRIIERVIEVPVTKVVEKVIEVPVDRVVEVPVEKIVEKFVEVEVLVERIVERLVEVEVPKEKIIERIIEVPVERVIEKVVEVYVPVERVVEVERIVEVPVERIVERIVEVPYSEDLAGAQVPSEQMAEKGSEEATRSAQAQSGSHPVSHVSSEVSSSALPPVGSISSWMPGSSYASTQPSQSVASSAQSAGAVDVSTTWGPSGYRPAAARSGPSLAGYVPSAGARSEPPGTAAGVVDFRQYSAQLAPEAEQQRF